MYLVRDLYSPETHIYALDDNGNEVELPKKYWSYHGNVDIIHKSDSSQSESNGTASVTFYDGQKFRALMTTKSRQYTVDLDYIRPELSTAFKY